ncbi:MAG TPA: DUF3795 domain-containing protein [Symbiobacteriaceae bacterium]|nr:DUF3795 domain-containing protein [Symbiobacteriaceae bacterium]
MAVGDLANSISYCGLVCGMCSVRATCTGCRNPIHPDDKCDKDHCYHRKCCLEHGLDGCWACSSFPCDEGRFADENRGQSVGFCQYISAHGKEALVLRLQANEAAGIPYGIGGAYRHQPLDVINRLLGV